MARVKIETTKRVVHQNIGGVSMEDYMAEQLINIEQRKIDLQTSETLIKGYKQLNVRHKNIIDVQRLELKQLEFNLEQEKKDE